MRRGEPGRLRAVALPTEHGGWGFALEPILLGAAVAPHPAGAFLAAAALAVFLARRPFRLLAADLRRGQRLPRTAPAAGVFLVCVALIGAGIVATAALAEGPFWWPLAAAAPFAVLYAVLDVGHRNRGFLAEAAGALALGAAAPAMALAAGGAAGTAFGLWAVIAGRALPSILLVRALIRRTHGAPSRPLPTHAAHAAALVALGTLAAMGQAPWLAVGAVALLWAWAGVSLCRPSAPTRTVGWTQVLAGLVVVALAALGHRFGW